MNSIVKYMIFPEDFSFSNLSKYVPFLSEERQKQIRNYRLEKDKICSLLVGLLLRQTMMEEGKVAVEDICILRQEGGKPYLKDREDFHFSLSHSGHCVAVAVSRTEIGVDVEKVKSFRASVARRFYTPAEQEYLAKHPDPEGSFFMIWTRKEAMIKLTGEGLRRKLTSFCVIEKNEIFHTMEISHAKERYFLSVTTGQKAEITMKSVAWQELLEYFEERSREQRGV